MNVLVCIKKILTIHFFFLVFALIPTKAETIILRFVITYNDAELGGNFGIRIQIKEQNYAAFGLGTSSFRFSYNVSALEKPVIDSSFYFTSPHDYAPIVMREVKPGIVSVNLNYIGNHSSGLVVMDWNDIASLNFNILDTTLSAKLDWISDSCYVTVYNPGGDFQATMGDLEDNYYPLSDFIFRPKPPEGYQWKNTGGPSGGVGYDIRIHPKNSKLMFVTDNPSGVNISSDGSKNWQQKNIGLTSRTGGSGDAIPIFTLAMDPNNPDILWTGTQDMKGIFRSKDCGETWERRDKGIIESDITFRGFAVQPGNSNVVLAAAEISTFIHGFEFDKTKGVIYKTIDAGINWYPVWYGENLARVLIFNPVNTNIVYCSTGIFDREAFNSDYKLGVPGGVGILKSENGGSSWFPVNNGLDNLYVGFMEMDFTNPDILYAASYNVTFSSNPGIFKTINGGASWNRISSKYGYSVITVSPSHPNKVYAASSEAFLWSDDYGKNWKVNENWGPPKVLKGFPVGIVVDPKNPLTVYVNNYGGGSFVTYDGGENWLNSSKGYTGARIANIALDKNNPGIAYCWGNSGPFKTVNGGNDWQGIYTSTAFAHSRTINIFPDNQNELLASDDASISIYRSLDKGESWNSILNYEYPSGQNGFYSVSCIAISEQNPNIIFAGTRHIINVGSVEPSHLPSFGIFKSSNRGKTWNRMNIGLENSGMSINAVAIDPTNHDNVYVGTSNDGIYKSTDGGNRWLRYGNGLGFTDVRVIAINPANPSVVLAGSGDGKGIYYSVNAGETWINMNNNGLEAKCPSYLGFVGNGIIGKNTEIPRQVSNSYQKYIPWTKVLDIVFDPSNSNYIYVADFNSGIYYSMDGGINWVHLNNGLLMRSTICLDISSDGKVLYAGTDGNGVYRLVLGGNKAPNISALIPNNADTISIFKGDKYSFEVFSYDLNDDSLTFSWKLDGMTLANASKRELIFNSDNIDLGLHSLISEVRDNDTVILVSWDIKILPKLTNILNQVLPGDYFSPIIYPNPASAFANIQYQIPFESKVLLRIYDLYGNEIRVLVNEKQSTGGYSIQWDCSDQRSLKVPNGIYICKIEIINRDKRIIQAKKILVNR